MSTLLNTAIDAARKAGSLLKEGLTSDFSVSSKSRFHDLVTEYDLRSERSIMEHIRLQFPDHEILTEESGHHHSEGEITWIIDPLDGTVNFAHGIPFFCISIAAMKDNEILCGVIYSPMTDELFTTELGKGAWCNGMALKVTNKTVLKESFLVTGFPYSVAENPGHCIDHFSHIVSLGIPIRRLGSAALDLAYVAAGRFDGFWEIALQPWDMAAGTLLVREAGGTVIDYAGKNLNVLQSSSIIAGNPFLVKDIQIELQKVDLLYQSGDFHE
ncbi:inositol monophosphatase [bacterium]|nr:inositol monophosphatase [bacterium]